MTIVSVAPSDPLGIQVVQGGPRGKAGTIAIGDVTTVAPDTPATVTNIGTEEEAVLNFKIPKGDPGLDSDMLQSVYDSNGDGKVDAADVADAVPWSGITSKPATFPATAHTHPAADISDASSDGRSILTAADYEAMRGLLGINDTTVKVSTVTKTDTFSLATTSTWTDVTGLSVTITPGSASSRIKIDVLLSLAHSGAASIYTRVLRGATPVGVGAVAGSRPQVAIAPFLPTALNGFFLPASITFVDEPATASSVTYTVQLYILSATAYLNRSNTDADGTSYARAISSITAMEVGA